jgi:simple sugar transport system permease protein
VHALLLFVAVVIGAVALWHLYRRRWVSGGISGAAALAVLAWFVLQPTVPTEFVRVMPYLTTLLVLALASQRLRMPAADGLPYRKGQGR